MKTVVFQSFRSTAVPYWVETCLGTVRHWAEMRGYDYRFFGDRIFQRVPVWVLQKAGNHRQISTDLARLLLAKDLLAEGYERVIWLDADVLIFTPQNFVITDGSGFAFGREIWVQFASRGDHDQRKLKAYRNVHNALSVYCQGNSFLGFYIDSCLKILERATGPLVPQVIGPKFLTALHNIIGFELIDAIGMASPLVIKDLANGGGQAWDRLMEASPSTPSGLNLCTSLTGQNIDDVYLTDQLVEEACKRLLEGNGKT